MIILAFLFIKHFIADFLYQPEYQWRNKGTLGHPGGLLHATQHAALTFVILLVFGVIPWIALVLAFVLEWQIHYYTDWAKMNINSYFGWKCDKHEKFWILLGLDQLIHSLTYVAIAYLATV